MISIAIIFSNPLKLFYYFHFSLSSMSLIVFYSVYSHCDPQNLSCFLWWLYIFSFYFFPELCQFLFISCCYHIIFLLEYLHFCFIHLFYRMFNLFLYFNNKQSLGKWKFLLVPWEHFSVVSLFPAECNSKTPKDCSTNKIYPQFMYKQTKRDWYPVAWSWWVPTKLPTIFLTHCISFWLEIQLWRMKGRRKYHFLFK